MSLVSTTILTFDNQTLVVPNAKIWGDVIRNITHQSIRRVDLEFSVGLEQDLVAIEQLLNDLLLQHNAILAEPASAVRLHRITDSAMLFIVRPWVKTEDYWPVYWDLTRAVKLAFDQAGIAIPHRQQDVHIISRDDAPSPHNQS
jgi:small conductance mechanosensitive channel